MPHVGRGGLAHDSHCTQEAEIKSLQAAIVSEAERVRAQEEEQRRLIQERAAVALEQQAILKRLALNQQAPGAPAPAPASASAQGGLPTPGEEEEEAHAHNAK